MMKEVCFPFTFHLSVPGQHEYRQFSLPKNVVYLTGLEFSCTTSLAPGNDLTMKAKENPGVGPLEIQSNQCNGLLTFMVPGCENIFLQQDVIVDNNLHYGETVALFENTWDARPYSFGTKREELSFRVRRSSNLVELIYKDAWRNDPGGFFPYVLRIYLWAEKYIL